MSRDYKYRDRRGRYNDRRRRKGPPPWAWAAVGLLVGLFVAFLGFLQLGPAPPVERTVKLETPPEPASRVPAEKPAPALTAAPAAVIEEQPAAPPKPRFDFYNLLPEMEVIVPEQEVQGAPTPEGVRQVEQPGTYLLQAGSFRTREQADQLRARLALLGVETDVQTVTVNNEQTWHRVRVGPFHNLRDLNTARSLLKKNGIDAILIRLAG
jgi:cell division protein FtsN